MELFRNNRILFIFVLFLFMCLFQNVLAQDEESLSVSNSISVWEEDENDRTPCTFQGQLMEHRKGWKMDDCTYCKCVNGTTNCEIQSCVRQDCPQGEVMSLPGVCCPQCPHSITVEDTINLQDPPFDFIEGSSLSFDFDVDIQIAKPKTTRTIRGKRMWKISAWLSPNEDGSGPQFSFTNDILTRKLSNQELFKPSYPPWGFQELSYKTDGSGICANLKYFCIKFNSGDNPAPEYSLPYTFFSLNGEEERLVDCKPLGACSGLTVNNFDWSMSESGASPGKVTPVSLTSSLSFLGEGRDLSGEGLWSMSLWGSAAADGSGSRFGEVQETLSEAQMATSLSAGGGLDINGINTQFEVGTIGCSPEVSFVCVEFAKGDAPNPDFTLNDPNGLLRSCKPRECASSAVFNSLSSNIISPPVIVEETAGQAVSASLTATTDPSSQSVSGEKLWEVSHFFSKSPSGEGPRISEQVQILNPAQQDIDLQTGADLIFDQMDFEIDLSGQRCHDVPYQCFELKKNPESSVGYIFGTNPVQDPFVRCESTSEYCKGVSFTDVSIKRKIPPHNRGDHAKVIVDADANTEDFSRSVEGKNLWQLKVYGARDKKGKEKVGPEFSQILTPMQASQSLERGGTLHFEGAETPPFDIDDIGCGEAKFLCFEFTKSTEAVPDFTVEYPSGDSIVRCRRESCEGRVYTK